jgi:hypothetical protein
MSYSAKINENSPLLELAAAIRRLDEAISEHQRSALRTSADLGDALAWARARVAPRQWKAWRADHCPKISKRREEVCRQLAAARPIIERALANDPDLSVRGALKLIAKPRSPKPKPAVLDKWRGLSAAEKREGLAADGVDAFAKYMPAEWRDELADRVARLAGHRQHAFERDEEVAKLARSARALLTHPQHNRDDIQKRLTQIISLVDPDEKILRDKSVGKSNVNLDPSLLPRALGMTRH